MNAMAEVPSLINYQGKLIIKAGLTPINDSSRNFTVRIFDAKTGGNLIYEETLPRVRIKDSVYSFAFGEAGRSILDFSESLIVGEDGKQIFDFTLSKTPVAESLSIEAGEFNWSEKTGSSDSDNLLVQYDKNNKSAKIIFLNSSPENNVALKFDYRVEEVALQQLPKIQKVENSIGFVYQLYFETEQDMRGKVFDFAHDNGLKILQLHQKNTTLEKLFSELTIQK